MTIEGYCCGHGQNLRPMLKGYSFPAEMICCESQAKSEVRMDSMLYRDFADKYSKTRLYIGSYAISYLFLFGNGVRCHLNMLSIPCRYARLSHGNFKNVTKNYLI